MYGNKKHRSRPAACWHRYRKMGGSGEMERINNKYGNGLFVQRNIT